MHTGYALPFPVWYEENCLSAGEPIRIRVRMGAPGNLLRLKQVLGAFADLALAGAFATTGHSSRTSVNGVVREVSAHPGELTVEMNADPMRDEALVVLAHMLLTLHASDAVAYVEVLALQQRNLVSLQGDPAVPATYPPRMFPLPFVLEDWQPEGDGCSFSIELESSLHPEREKILNSALGAWLQAIHLGGYAMAPMDPADSYVETDGEGVTAYGTSVEWAVFKLRADSDAALDGFLNVLACFHARQQAIRSVEIG